MSNPAIPKEQMTPYERWELPNFGAGNTAGTAHFSASAHPHGGTERAVSCYPPRRRLPVSATGPRRRLSGGYAAGVQEAQRMTALANSMQQALQQVDQQIAQDLLALSLEVARQMVQQAVRPIPNTAQHHQLCHRQPAPFQSGRTPDHAP